MSEMNKNRIVILRWWRKWCWCCYSWLKKKGFEVFVSDRGEIKEIGIEVFLKSVGIDWEEGKHTEAKILTAGEVD